MDRSSSLTVSARETARHKLDLVGVNEVRCDKGDPVIKKVIFFSMEKETKIIDGGKGFLYNTEEYRQLKRVEFVIDRTSYIV